MSKNLSIIISFSLVLIFSNLSNNQNTISGSDADEKAGMVLSKLTVDQKIGQLLMMPVPSTRMNGMIRKIMSDLKPGGVVLFRFNIESSEKLTELLRNVQDSSEVPLFTAIDQEGGVIKRIQEGMTQFPGTMAMGSSDDPDLVEKAARIIGIELRKIGVNINLMPIVDVNNNPKNPIINVRAFGSDPEHVGKMGAAYVKGLQSGKCIAVAKHFPGHGDTSNDSHKTLPVINHDLDRLRKVEFRPFEKAIDADVEIIMSAHISYPAILGDNTPATLSKKFMTDILKGDLSFKGIVLSDDLAMSAIAGKISIGESAVRALESGVDMMLITTYGPEANDIINSIKKAKASGRISEERIDSSVKKILAAKIKYGILTTDKEGNVYPGSYEISNSEKELLRMSEVVNQTLSDESLYFYTYDNIGIAKSTDDIGVISTSSRHISKNLSGKKDWHIVGRDELYSTAAKLASANPGKRIKAYAEWSSPGNYLANQFKSSKLKNIDLIFLSFQNPFVIAGMDGLPPTLFVFSNTLASEHSALKAITGEITPKTSCKINFGIK